MYHPVGPPPRKMSENGNPGVHNRVPYKVGTPGVQAPHRSVSTESKAFLVEGEQAASVLSNLDEFKQCECGQSCNPSKPCSRRLSSSNTFNPKGLLLKTVNGRGDGR
ncbi:hypothetical protein RB195_000934 [Necator americanus]|uniref:Uncharacterized protein n=1 Tax=Necator americanus TaxID=51031 RepID=A0ABR1DCM8_NECAM